jgi:hypothetical protein
MKPRVQQSCVLLRSNPFNDRNLALFLSQHKLESLELHGIYLNSEISCKAVTTAQVQCLTLEYCDLEDEGLVTSVWSTKSFFFAAAHNSRPDTSKQRSTVLPHPLLPPVNVMNDGTESFGLLKGVDTHVKDWYSDDMSPSPQLSQHGLFWAMAEKDAKDLNCTTKGYMDELDKSFDQLMVNGDVFDRTQLKEDIRALTAAADGLTFIITEAAVMVKLASSKKYPKNTNIPPVRSCWCMWMEEMEA